MDRATDDAMWRGELEIAEESLTSAEAMSLAYIAPPPDLQPFVTTFFLFRCDEPVIRDVQPAAVGQFQVYLRGRGQMHYPHGRIDRSHPVTLQGPTTVAAPFEVEGPFHALGAALSGLGWVVLTGMPADHAVDRLFDAGEVLGPGAHALGETLREAYEANPATDGEELVQRTADFMRSLIRPVPDGHKAVLKCVADWLGSDLNPPVQALYDACGYSPRQVQRLVTRYFGSSPSHLVRVYRATRVVALLSEPGVTDERVAELTDAFYDQPHMIREIREFVGRTPRQLFAENETILRTLVDVRNFREIKPSVAPLPPLASPDLERGSDDA